jgi:hypothetical protein
MSGNPAGRPPGARHKTTIMLEQQMVDDAERVTKRVIQAAIKGNMVAAKLILDRAVPPRKARVAFEVPPVRTAADAVVCLGRIVEAMARGELSAEEAAAVSSVVETFRRVIETETFEERLSALERRPQ